MALFRMFLQLRVGDEWLVELSKMRNWVIKSSALA
jgi:hypothetical protein